MGTDHNDIYSIVERLRILEEGLDKNQRSVNQLSATFKPKTVAVLTAKTDPKNPMAGKLVGGSESAEDDREPVEEAVANEDVLNQVKKSFTDYLKSVADEVKQDSDIKEKGQIDQDLKDKVKKDLDLIAKKVEKAVDEDTTEWNPEPTITHTSSTNPIMPESAPVKTVQLDEVNMFEIHGNERDGFEIRRGNRCMLSRFKSLDQAQMALEMFAHRLSKRDQAQDYIDEA